MDFMVAKKSTKKRSAKRTSATKKTAKGKRYSEAKKRQVVDFANEVNAERGRGGVSAAARKFGVTPLTISKWIKDGSGSGAPPVKQGRKPVGGDILQQLVALNAEIKSLEAELAGKTARFDMLKRQL